MALRKRGELLKFASERGGTQKKKGEGGSLRKGVGVGVGLQPSRKLCFIFPQPLDSVQYLFPPSIHMPRVNATLSSK